MIHDNEAPACTLLLSWVPLGKWKQPRAIVFVVLCNRYQERAKESAVWGMLEQVWVKQCT